MYALRAEVDKMYRGGAEAEHEGRPVAWVMLEGWANPILNAMGIRTVYPENYSSVCAALGVATPYLERAEAEGFPSHLCGYARASIGYSAAMADAGGAVPADAPAGGMPRPAVLVGSGFVCDARFKWFQALGRYFDAPLWTLESPAQGPRENLEPGAHERNVRLLVAELHAFVEFLEKLVGRRMDWEAFDRISRGTWEINRWRFEINQLRRATPGPMHTRDFWSAMSAALYRGAADPQVIVDGHREMYEEVRQRVEDGVAGINREERYRLSFEGLAPWHSLGFLDRLADRGWNSVIESAYRPTRPVVIDEDAFDDPIERYVRSRSRSVEQHIDAEFEPAEAASIKDEIRRTGTSPWLYLQHVRDHRCDGVILHVLLTCRAASAGLHLLREQLQETLKVPALVIEGDIIDTGLFDPTEALRKAEAFEETMDHYRELRRSAGLGW
jgi:benzoyl-CoA reductase/2-hydroxyglutaryl-CoA dehydratase subunit BcrC/BadD/HgdB